MHRRKGTALTEFAMDTVAGLLRVKAEVRDGSVNQVTIENVPAFYVEDYQTTLSTGTLVTLEIAYGGLYYAFVDSNLIGISLKPKNAGRLIKLGMELIRRPINHGLLLEGGLVLMCR